MNEALADTEASSLPELDPEHVAAGWLKQLQASFAEGDARAVASLFGDQGWWRDHLMFDWDLRTLHGRAAIADYLGPLMGKAGAVRLDLSSDVRPSLVDGPGGRRWVEAFFEIESGAARGDGVFRLTEVDGDWSGWTMLSRLTEIKGHEPRLGSRRPAGVSHGARRSQTTWLDERAREVKFEDGDPQVVILGGGQGGLMLAARLMALGVSCLIIEANDRIGDSWRKRYKSLVLHDPVWANHLPYFPFPPTWPVYTPKDKLANWFESYADALDLNVWTSATLGHVARGAEGGWDLEVRTRDGEVRRLRTHHFVIATGTSGLPWTPTIPGENEFRGEVIHSSGFDAANGYKDKSVVIVGACNSAHDIAHDLAEQGADVTMVQRSHTHVMSSEHGFAVHLAGVYGEDAPPVERSDLMVESIPLPVLFELHTDGATPEITRRDAQMIEGLTNAGFKFNYANIQELYLRRGGGYYIDVGASQAIIDGRIRIKQGVEVDHFVPDGVVYTDGTEQRADVVVYATGYNNMREVARTLLGDEIADACDLVWGIDDEGEMRGIWRRTGVEGLWFMGGNLALARPYSKVLALQIQAHELGLTK